MLVEHQGKRPRVHPSAWIAPTAVISGEVTIGAECRVLAGAVVTADGGPVTIGQHGIVMETAVLRGSKRHPLRIGDHVLVGPRAYLSGCTVADCVFLATGATIFNGATVEARAQVRINGIVHLKTRLPEESVVPIGWIAVGDPAEILPPDRHDEIWSIQKELNFPREVFGLERRPGEQSMGSLMPELTRRYAKALARHRDDRVIEPESKDA
ncbi:MAG: gamma carbonic anhydrase family protein [Alphaproteobacteria bacterium]|nr:gamma carbonic anhydrase family protein [Alphaproteobacteria bacterium]